MEQIFNVQILLKALIDGARQWMTIYTDVRETRASSPSTAYLRSGMSDLQNSFTFGFVRH